MYHSDYTIRMIQQFVVFIARVAGLLKKDDPRVVLIEIEQAYRGILGLDPGLVHSLTADSLYDLLSRQEDHVERIAITAMILKREAETAIQTRDPDVARRHIAKAERLLELLGDVNWSEELPKRNSILEEIAKFKKNHTL